MQRGVSRLAEQRGCAGWKWFRVSLCSCLPARQLAVHQIGRFYWYVSAIKYRSKPADQYWWHSSDRQSIISLQRCLVWDLTLVSQFHRVIPVLLLVDTDKICPLWLARKTKNYKWTRKRERKQKDWLKVGKWFYFCASSILVSLCLFEGNCWKVNGCK